MLYAYFSNFSTFKPAYNTTEKNLMIQNGYNIATMGNGTVDSEWLTCVGCAVLSRSLVKTGTEIPAACVKCFNKYCWNGTINSTSPMNYEPAFMLKTSAANGLRFLDGWIMLAVLATVVFILVSL